MTILGCGAQMRTLMDISPDDVQSIEDTLQERLKLGVPLRKAQQQAVEETMALVAAERRAILDAVAAKLEKQKPSVASVSIAEPAIKSVAEKDIFANNKLFTSDKVAEARKRMKAKLGTMNSGIDPELLMDGMVVAGAYIESGVRSFAEFAKSMVSDMGDGVKPYLLSFWEGARNYPGMDTAGMTSAEDSATQHAALITPEVIEQSAEVLGEVVAKPAKKPRTSDAKLDMTLRQDWGVEYIQGYGIGGDSETGNPTKTAFLKDAKNYLSAVYSVLADRGYSPYLDRKGKENKPVYINESGAAGSGDAHLSAFNEELGQGLYVSIGDCTLRGVVPTTKSGIAIMYRTSGKSPYSDSGTNQWSQVDLTAAEFADMVHKHGSFVANVENPTLDKPEEKADIEAKDTQNDSTTTRPEITLDSPLDDGQRPAGSETPARGARPARSRKRRGNDGDVLGPRGLFDEPIDDGESVGDRGGNPEIQHGTNGNVAGVVRRTSADFVPAVGGLTREGSWFDTAKRNIDLIELAIKIDGEKRTATKEEQEQLSKYVGFGAGAIRNELFPVPPAYAKSQEPNRLIWPNYVRDQRWKPLSERIEALPREWQQSILQSSQYAHYTSESLIRSIWSAIQRIGFTGGNVFEPGTGIGSFAMLMPQNVRDTSKYTGVEFDGPTALIGKLLSPDQNLMHGDFIKRKFPKNFFDVNVGNPPFSQTKVLGDPDYEKQGFMLHDFFFAKGIDLVRPGGLQVFVTSKGTMDKQNDKARKYLSDRADLLGAIRLPSTAFEDNAGTSVVTDVIFLRKRKEGEAPAGESWNNTETVETPDGTVIVNEYFAKHPEMVLGQQRLSGGVDDLGRRINHNGMGGPKYTVVSYDKTPAELDARFAEAIEKLPENAYSALSQSDKVVKAETAKVDFDPSIKREGVIYVAKNGDLMRVHSGVGKPLDIKLSENDKSWFTGYVGLRDMIQDARAVQVSDGDWETSLKKLNKAYDAFVKKHGPILDYRVVTRKSTDEDGNVVATETRVSKNRRLYREDYDNSIVIALETINEAGEVVKAPFLLGRTIGKPTTREVKSIGDALAVSLDTNGSLNLDDIAHHMKMGREEVIEALGNQIYKAPSGEWQLADEYLSGNVVDKLEEAEQAARINPEFERNVEALKAAQPEKLGPSQISAKLGASWVPATHVNDFAEEIGSGAVTFDSKTESWAVVGGNLRSGRNASEEYGTAKRSPSELLEMILNSRPIKIMTKTADDKTVVDVEATTAANEAAKKIKDKFKSWVWTDSERAAELVESYNLRFNNIAPRQFNGDHLTLPGVSLRFKLHPHQLRAIWRMVQTGDTYLAHAVGAGKTIEMIAGGMEQKRLGLIKKPMYVVPNHMLEQFSNEFMELYPLANIMVADDENFSAERRKAFIASATLNNPDAIVITHDAFQRIGVSEESVAPIRDEIISDLEIELSNTAKDQGARVRRSQLEQQIEAVTQRFDRIIGAGGKDSTIKFEDMGVDFVFADEAHAYRKLDFHTSQQIKGIDPNGSKRALDMYVKTRVLARARPGRSMVFASGTPVTNTMGELYTIMRFFAQAELDKSGISTFDSWARQFGEVAPALEPNAAGKYELVERFAKFDNVPELMSRVRQFMDVLTSEHLGALVKRPDLKGGKPHLNVVEATPALKEYMEGELARRIEISKKWKPSPGQKGNPDPIVKIITDGRFAAIDPRFFGKNLGPGEKSILTEMGDKIIANYKAGSSNVYLDKKGNPEPIKGSSQIVFYNLGFGDGAMASRGFNSRATFTKHLTDGGIKREHIYWFDDANTDAKKEAVFKDMRSGKLRVLIGSAKKMGTGVNVQKRLQKLHFQDPPWYPADVEQPHGRILRQGNQNEEIEIEWYTTKGTYQSTMWQMVGRKQRFIDQAFTGDKTLRSMDDMGEASLFEQAAAVASGDPRALQLAGLRQDVERFQRLQAAHATEQIHVKSALGSAEWGVTSAKKQIKTYSDAFKAIGERYFAFTSGTVGGSVYAKPGEFGQAIKDAFNKQASKAIFDASQDVEIGKIGDNITLSVDAEIGKNDKPDGTFSLYVKVGDHSMLLANAMKFGEDVDATGLARRVFNLVNSIETNLNDSKRKLTANETDVIKLRKKLGAPFEHQQEMTEKYGELKQLEAELQAEGQAVVKAGDVKIDPDGAMFSRAQTETQAFKAWFGDSKVVDAEGKPLVVYHGTGADFNTFEGGAFFTDDYYNADGYASGERVIEAFISLKNPLIIDAKGKKWNELKNKQGSSTREIISKLDIKKNDGVIFKNIKDSWIDDEDAQDAGTVYFVASPTQIKSATGNNGNFDASNPDIRYSQGKNNGGLPASKVQSIVDTLKSKWAAAPDIVVATTMDDAAIPQKVRDYNDAQLSQGATGAPEGFFYGGKVYLIADQLPTAKDVHRVLFHETLGHVGLRGAFGESLTPILKQISVMRKAEVTAKAKEYGLDMAKESDRLQAAEEVLAVLAQTKPEMGFVKRAIAAIRTWLRAHGVNLQLSDGDIVANYILPARAFVEGGKGATAGDTAFSRQSQTPAFKAWFGDSKVVDSEGKPLVVYHSTSEQFTVFDKEKIGSANSSTVLQGFYFADRPLRDADKEMAVYLSLKNPIVIDVKKSDFDTIGAQEAIQHFIQNGTETYLREYLENYRDMSDDEISEQMMEWRGADGAILKNTSYDVHSDEFIVFNPAQIKSATGNNGEFDASNSDIRFARKMVGETDREYTPEQLKAMENVGFKVETSTLADRAKHLQKDFWKKLAQNVADQFAPVKDIDEAAYRLLRLSKGASGAFETFLHGGKLKIEDGVYNFDEANRGGVIEELLIPLEGEHHDFMRWIAANRAERLKVAGKENLFSDQDIAAIKTLADGKTKFDYVLQHGTNAGQTTRDRTLIYADSLKTFNEFNKNILDMAEQSGLIDGGSRVLWENEFYVPFYRVADDSDGGIRGMNIKGGAVRQTAFKTLKGGKNALNADLLDNTLMNWAHLLDASAKNRAAKATIEAAESIGAAVAGDQKQLAALATTLRNKNGVVWFMDKGQKRYSLINADDGSYLFDAITALEYAGIKNPVMNAMSSMKHALTIGVTASPFFKIRNLIRDSVQVIATSGISANPIKNVAQGFGLTKNGSDAYFKLLAGGGTIHFGTMFEGSEAKRVQSLVEMGIDKETILDNPQKLKAFYHKVIKPSWDAYNELGNRGEAVNRAALYDQLIKQGKTHAEASYQARDLMDFSMQGTSTAVRFLTQVVPFFNARIQGMYKLGRGVKEDPKRFALVLGATAAVSLGLLAAYHDDEDWKKREEWDRNNFWWFKINGVAYRIPKPFEIGAIATLAERGFEYAFDNEMTGKRLMKQVSNLLMDNLSMNPIPQLFKPVLDIYSNKDSFTGNQIESDSAEKLQSEYRYTSKTSMTSRAISTGLNAVTGVIDKEALSPVQVEHLLRGYFGWLGSFVVGAADIVARPATNQPEKPSSDLWKWATGGMISNLDDAPSRYVSQMYDQAKEIEQAYSTYRNLQKQGKEEEADKFAEKNVDKLNKYRSVERVKKSASRINEQIRIIERSALDSVEKREKIRELNRAKERMAMAVN